MPSKPPGGSTVECTIEARVERKAGRRQRRQVPLPPVAGSRDVVRFRDEPDPPVAVRNQMLDEPASTAQAVADDDVGFDSGDGAIDQDEWHAEPREPLEVHPSSGR